MKQALIIIGGALSSSALMVGAIMKDVPLSDDTRACFMVMVYFGFFLVVFSGIAYILERFQPASQAPFQDVDKKYYRN